MKEFKPLPPVTRLTIMSCDMTDGTSIQIVTDLESSQMDALAAKWLRKTKKASVENLIDYVKARKPFCIIVSKQQYDKEIAPHGMAATKEEFEKENN